MSKLVEKVRRAGEAGKAIGFGAKRQGGAPGLVLLACIAANDPRSLEAALAAGADALLFQGDPALLAPASQERLAALPWGWVATDAHVPQGCDFVVLAPQAPLSFLREAPWGRLLRLSLPLPQGLLRGLASLPIDALFIDVAQQQELMTLQQLALCQQALLLSAKPAILGVPDHLSPADLAVLRDGGMRGVALVVREGEAHPLRAFREAIAALPPPKRRGERPIALLPQEALYPAADLEEDEDGEDSRHPAEVVDKCVDNLLATSAKLLL